MARSWYTRSNAKPKFIQTPRVQAVARELAFLRRNQHVPYLFGHTDDVAVAMRKRARDRAYTIHREQQYLKLYRPNFGNYKMNKYRSSMTYHPSKYKMNKRTMIKKFGRR